MGEVGDGQASLEAINTDLNIDSRASWGFTFDINVTDLDSTTKFSFGFGGGVKFLASDHVGARLEFRGYSTNPTSRKPVGSVATSRARS